MKIIVKQHAANDSQSMDLSDLLMIAAQAIKGETYCKNVDEQESESSVYEIEREWPDGADPNYQYKVRKSRLEEINRVYKTCKTAYELYASSRDTLETLLVLYHDDYGALDPEGVLNLLDKELKDVCL